MTQTPTTHSSYLATEPFDCDQANNCPLLQSFVHHEQFTPDETSLPNQLPSKWIGIPTTDGMDFLKIKEVIRCEGMQRLTRVYTKFGTITSSYHIGQFSRLFAPFDFFATHKSHLINLQYLQSYYTIGVILLRDGSKVPLARRRREAFLKLIHHL